MTHADAFLVAQLLLTAAQTGQVPLAALRETFPEHTWKTWIEEDEEPIDMWPWEERRSFPAPLSPTLRIVKPPRERG